MPDEPLPPDVLADALQDKVHREIGIVRPAKAVRLMPADEEAADTKAHLARMEGVVAAAREMALAIRTLHLDMRGPAYNVYGLESQARSVPAINALLKALAELD